MTKLLGALVAVASLLLLSGIVLATNQWEDFHWPSDNRTLEYDDATTATFDIPGHASDWNGALPAGVSLVDAGGGAFDVEITEGRLRGIWIGVASILVESATGHILEGTVTLNTPKFSLTDDEWAHVACQEIGHILGLDHNRDGDTGGTPDDTCMNDRDHLGEFLAPNGHDAVELAGMYGHDDAPPPTATPTPTPDPDDPTPTPTPEPDDEQGGPPCSANPTHPRCHPDAEWVVVHVFPAP